MTQTVDWTARSARIDALQVEVCFLLNDTFYRGDENSHAQLHDPAFRVPLPLPAFPRALPLLARSSEVSGHEHELAAYYRRIVDQAAALGKPFNAIGHYFWLRLWLWQEGGAAFSFPWYDTLGEMHPLLDWLQAPSADAPYSDIEQGWDFDALRIGETIHLRQGDSDSGEEHVNVALPAGALAPAAAQAQKRAAESIAALALGLGADVWTGHLPHARFGTATWQPGAR